MGLHASYFPIDPERLARIAAILHTFEGAVEINTFRRESDARGEEFYIGTRWHVLDFLINPPGLAIPELAYAVRGRAFAGPDGTVEEGPHLPSYDDELWQVFTYVSAAEVAVISPLLSVLTPADFEARYEPRVMQHLYRAPSELDPYDLEVAAQFQRFYRAMADAGKAIFISIG